MMPDILQIIKSNMVLYHDYRSRSFFDHSENGNSGTPNTQPYFTGASLKIKNAGVVTVTDAPELQGTEGCIVIHRQPGSTSANPQRIYSKRDAIGTHLEVSVTDTQLVLNDGVADRTISSAPLNVACIGINFKTGTTGEAFYNGVSVGAFSSTMVITPDDAPLKIGNDYLLGNAVSSPLYSIIVFDRNLTATEHQLVCDRLTSMRWPTIPSVRILNDEPNDVVDGDMEYPDTSAWTIANNAILLKVQSSLGGTAMRVSYGGSNSPHAKQLVLKPEEKYRITGFARGNGISKPAILLRADLVQSTFWVGTTSTSWQYFDETFYPSIEDLKIYCFNEGGDNWAEFDNVRAWKINNVYPLLFKTDFGAMESVNALSSGYLENTPFIVESGSFRVGTESVNGVATKVVIGVTYGTIRLPVGATGQDPEQVAYGTWDFWIYNAGAGIGVFDIVGNSSVSQSGNYGIYKQVDGSCVLQEWGVGAVISGFSVGLNVWTRVTVTRNAFNEFVVYINGVSVGSATDATITTSYDMHIALSAGDKIALGAIDGSRSIVKKVV